MRHILSALVIASLVVTTACSHNEPTLADELAAENLGQTTEVGNTAPTQDSVTAETLGEPAVLADAPPVAATKTKSFAKKKKKSRKMLAKAKKRKGRRRSKR